MSQWNRTLAATLEHDSAVPCMPLRQQQPPQACRLHAHTPRLIQDIISSTEWLFAATLEHDSVVPCLPPRMQQPPQACRLHAHTPRLIQHFISSMKWLSTATLEHDSVVPGFASTAAATSSGLPSASTHTKADPTIRLINELTFCCNLRAWLGSALFASTAATN